MPRYALKIEYDGRPFCGWQRQCDQPSVQGAVEAALARLRQGDLVIVTADHSNDPTWAGTDHTRERVPALFAATGLAPRALGACEFADIGATAAAWLGLAPGAYGRSLL